MGRNPLKEALSELSQADDLSCRDLLIHDGKIVLVFISFSLLIGVGCANIGLITEFLRQIVEGL